MKKKIPFGYPIIGKEEKEEIKKVLNGHILAHGPRIKKFEKNFSNFTKSPYSISVSSCTTGMHLVYEALNIKKGDEVILPAQTHVATAHAIEHCGAKPVFVDCDPLTGNISPKEIVKKISKKTKAITVVHFLGLPVDFFEIKKVANKYKLKIIEDCALSLGAKFNKTHTGLLGDAGVFSFYPVKHITTGEGGMIITKNKNIANRLKITRALGVDKTYSERKIPGMYDTKLLGYNYRMSEFQAAIGIHQLKKVDFFLKKRKQNFNFLLKELKKNDNIRILPGTYKSSKGSHYCISIILGKKIKGKRRYIIHNLNKKGIGTSIYYPQPVPRMTYYKKKYGYKKKFFKNSEEISDCSICLPIGPHINLDDCKYMVKIFSNILKKNYEKN
tara:strand:+ start:930 stop:2087 length:1158 start_codon:yes stop_codon:yes gene_type:complete